MCTQYLQPRFLPNSPPKWCNGWTFPIAVYESFCSSTSQFYSLHMLHACCVYAKSLQLCPTLCDPLDCSPSGSSAHGILQARILEWVAMPSSRGSSQPMDQNCISGGSCIAGGFFTAEPPGKPWCTYLHVANLCEVISECFNLHPLIIVGRHFSKGFSCFCTPCDQR